MRNQFSALTLAAMLAVGAHLAFAQGVNGYLPGQSPMVNSLLMPFIRTAQDPIIFDASETATTYQIVRPEGSTSYRFTNPCDVDVRIRSVASMDDKITKTQGTLYLARTQDVMGSSAPSFVSIITMGPTTKPCRPELMYGRGS